ncbi:MAG: diguanylate cyclase [Candidatus Omnitrophica bacterium]|nr:diguanylate cyclase [Candidatus Omnitrophota bacterium]
MKKNKDSASASKRLKYKLRVLFYVCFLPVFVSIYFVLKYIVPQSGFRLDIIVYTLATIFIAIEGFFLIKEAFLHFMSITREAKLIAAGKSNRRIDIGKEDDVGELADALNKIMQRVQGDINELKGYGEKTTEINLEIQKRVFLLSSLLEISSLVSQGTKLDNIFKLVVEKSRLLANSEVAYLFFREEEAGSFYMKIVDGLNAGHLSRLKIDPDNKIFNQLIKTKKPLILDKDNILPEELGLEFYEKFKLKNNLSLPIYLKENVIGVLGIGNTKESFSYRKDDIELLDVFSRQVAIAVEYEILTHRIEKLEIKDSLTGLYNEAFIRTCLQDEIRRAIIYQRPCSLALMNIDNFKAYQKNFGAQGADAALKRVATLIKDSISEVDRVARISSDEFAIVLPERNKRQAQNIAEETRKRIEFSFSEEQDINKRITVSGGISENPLDGIDTDGLFSKARESLNFAKNQGKNRIAGSTICQ